MKSISQGTVLRSENRPIAAVPTVSTRTDVSVANGIIIKWLTQRKVREQVHVVASVGAQNNLCRSLIRRELKNPHNSNQSKPAKFRKTVGPSYIVA